MPAICQAATIVLFVFVMAGLVYWRVIYDMQFSTAGVVDSRQFRDADGDDCWLRKLGSPRDPPHRLTIDDILIMRGVSIVFMFLGGLAYTVFTAAVVNAVLPE